MSNKESNYPTAQVERQLKNADSSYIGSTVDCLMKLADKGKPNNVTELKERINQYFQYCAENEFKPGIESLSLSLGCNRSTFWRWANGELGVSEEWADCCKMARQIIVSFIEAAATSNHLSPPIAIFILKNVGGYKDSISFEELMPDNPDRVRKCYDGISSYRLNESIEE